MMMFLHELKVMQDGLRLKRDQLMSMLEFVAKGGRFNKVSLEQHNPDRTSLVAITEFEDGTRYIRDGLHRSAVALLARNVPVLFEDEFVIEKMTYEMYLETNIDNEWYTPFDPRHEVRKADFFDFKEEVLSLIQEQEDAVSFIKRSKSRYAIPRNEKHTLGECAGTIWRKINSK